MRKLAAVEEAKALLREAAQDWSVWKWLWDKKRVRQTADRAWDALDELEKQVRSAWSDDLRRAYDELVAQASLDDRAAAKRRYEKATRAAEHVPAELKLVARRLREADEEAYNARMQAEETFAEAERQLSTSMAREGSAQAIGAWELREKFIRRAEAAARSKPA